MSERVSVPVCGYGVLFYLSHYNFSDPIFLLSKEFRIFAMLLWRYLFVETYVLYSSLCEKTIIIISLVLLNAKAV